MMVASRISPKISFLFISMAPFGFLNNKTEWSKKKFQKKTAVLKLRFFFEIFSYSILSYYLRSQTEPLI
ncbi:hypothetical protein, partial [Vibrio owensii]|uniref:hypothetical protein n=1 Tax=Vibrio owensii TaxID=696485 RepID=UPI001A8E5B75